MTKKNKIKIKINGKNLFVKSDTPIKTILNKHRIRSKMVAIELNGKIVDKSKIKLIKFKNKDRLEIVHFIGGGWNMEDFLKLDKRKYKSRLIVGTGKYKSFEECAKAIKVSGAQIVTVAVRRVNIIDKNKPLLMDYINPKKITYLPNTAGCFNSQDALRTLRLAREIGGWKLVKLEVLGDKKNLFPDMIETLNSTEELVKEGFKVMVYCNDDPLMAKRLENVGASAIMPLASPIGSGLGILNKTNIEIIRSQTKLPLIIDAGLGDASDASIAMQLGCDGVLVNTAIAKAKKPLLMAEAMRLAVISGRKSFLSGRIKKNIFGSASSPKTGII